MSGRSAAWEYERARRSRLRHKCEGAQGPAHLSLRVPAARYVRKGNSKARAALDAGEVCVLGGTAWTWAPSDMAGSVDVLFIDEAGQLSLATALAVAQGARSLVLLGDPQQLQQPKKGARPDGAEVSALEHLLGPCPRRRVPCPRVSEVLAGA